MRLTIVIFLMVTSLLFASAKAQGTFPINSSTRIVLNGEQTITFDQFAEYTTTYAHELVPSFNDDGSLLLLNVIIDGIVESSYPTNSDVDEPKIDYDAAHQVAKSKASYTVVQELIDQEAPKFRLQTLSGEEIDLSNLRDKAVVLNFWFSKCAPCLDEIPELNELKADYSEDEVVFIALSIEDQVATQRFLESNDFDFTIIPQAHKVAGQYKVQGYPTTVVIDRHGMVDDVFVGGMTDPYRVINNAIQKALVKNESDLSVELLRADEGLFFAESTVYDQDGDLVGENAFYDAIMNFECKIYKHTKENKSIYYTLTKLNPK